MESIPNYDNWKIEPVHQATPYRCDSYDEVMDDLMMTEETKFCSDGHSYIGKDCFRCILKKKMGAK